MTKDII